MYAVPESVGCAYQLLPGEVFQINGIDASFSEPKRDNYEVDNFRNMGYTNKIDNHMNGFRKNGFCIPEEERATTQWNGLTRNFTSQNKVLQQNFFDRAKTTIRQTRQSRRNGNLKNVGREVGAHSFQQQFTNVKPTHKQNTILSDYKGIAAANSHAIQTDREQYNCATHRGVKEDSLSGYTPGAQGSLYANGTNDTFISIKNQLGNQETINPLVPSVPIQTIRNKGSSGITTSFSNADRVSEYNQHLDLGIAVSQLGSNPFALTPFFTSRGI